MAETQTAAPGIIKQQASIPIDSAPRNPQYAQYANWHEAFDELAKTFELKRAPGWVEGKEFAFAVNEESCFITLPPHTKDSQPLLCLALARAKLVELGFPMPQISMQVQDIAFKKAMLTKDKWDTLDEKDRVELLRRWKERAVHPFLDWFSWILVQEKLGAEPVTLYAQATLQKLNTQLLQDFEHNCKHTGFAFENLLYAIEWFAMLPWKFSAVSVERNKLLSLWTRTAGLPGCSNYLPRAGVDKVARASAVFEQFGKKYFKSTDWQKDPAMLQKEFSNYLADIWANTGVDVVG